MAEELKTVYPVMPVTFFPEIRNYTKLTVFISAIGNDLFLSPSPVSDWASLVFNPQKFIDRLDGIFKAYRKKYHGCNVVYIFPYRPGELYGWKTTGIIGMALDNRINTLKHRIQALDSVDNIIDLSTEFIYGVHHVLGSYKFNGNVEQTPIPEPTKKGAILLARLMLDQHQHCK
jgi:hypothetical protein